MTLIIGGAFQGKTDFAAERLGVSRADVLDGESCAVDGVFGAAAVRHFERLIKRVISDSDRDARDFARELCERNPAITVISTEIGSGIIPLDRGDREWREAVGGACCVLAEFADTVVRVSCGIPTVIKGTMP